MVKRYNEPGVNTIYDGSINNIDTADRLMREGIDPSEFEFMNDDERRDALRIAGIDMDDFEDEDEDFDDDMDALEDSDDFEDF